MTIPVKILYVHHGSGEGGAANSLLYLLQNLDRHRFEPLVACNFRHPKAQDFFSRHGFPPVDLQLAPFVHTMKTWRLTTPRGVAKLAQWIIVTGPAAKADFHRLLKETAPDIVHLNGLSILPLAVVAKRLGIKVVQHVRESINEGHFAIRKTWLINLARRCTDHIIYICADNQERMTGRGLGSTVVYNPIEFNKFKAYSRRTARQNLGIPLENQVLFFPSGSLFDIKGIIPFLNALADTRIIFPNTCAIIPGLDRPPHPRDDFRRQIEQLIESRNLQTAVLRLPFTTAVEEYYASCDIVVAPFIHPHFSRAVIEAGAMARPVVGSRIGGITEVLQDGKVGLLATPGDIGDLAKKICYLTENQEIAAEMGKAGYDTARRRFDAVDHARAVMGIYDRVLGTPGIK